MTNRIDTAAAAIDHIRSITPADDHWTAYDVSSFSPWEPDESDYAIATILNAVVSGQLINRASRDEMLVQVRRGEGFATSGAEDRWIEDMKAGVYDTDAVEAERAKVAAAHEAAAEVYWDGFPAWDTFSAAREAIRTLTPADAQAALDKLLAEARLEGWRAGRDAAAHACDWGDIYGDNAVRAIRALPEPKENNHDD